MTTPNLDDLWSPREPGDTSRRGSKFPRDVARERLREQNRRAGAAQGIATTALRRLHRDDYRALINQARAHINAECGPLPGDELLP